MINKIYIIGPVGSGKSTLAKRLAEEYNFIYCELDSVVHEHDLSSPSGNRKRTEEERDSLVNAVIYNDKWIVEDTGRICFEYLMREADSVIQLEPPVFVRKRRILLRWIKQRLKLEKCGYNPNLTMLKLMSKWTKEYENGTDGVKERLAKYKDKIYLIKTKRDIAEYIKLL